MKAMGGAVHYWRKLSAIKHQPFSATLHPLNHTDIFQENFLPKMCICVDQVF